MSEKGSPLSAQALKKAAILAAVARFRKGPQGQKRLQKVIYHATRNSKRHPFAFKYWHHGQYSPEISEMLDELVSDGLLEFEVLPRGSGKWYRLTIEGRGVAKHLASIDWVFPGFGKALNNAVKEVGYKRDEEVEAWAKAQPEMADKQPGDWLLEENILPAEEVSGLTESQAEDLELALNSSLLSSACKVVRSMRVSRLDSTVLHEWDGEAQISSART